MMDIVIGVLIESFDLLNKMSIYLLFGFLFAGILHIFLKEGTIAKHLGKSDFSSVIKASLFGIPLPLCSCGVIPAALSLKKEGASKGAILSFLISTPTTGIDSILATYGLLGGVFAAFRVFAAFITGITAGLVANIFFKAERIFSEEKKDTVVKSCCSHHKAVPSNVVADKIKGVFQYAFVDLLKDTGVWILLGILIGGMISYFIPEVFISKYLGSGLQSMLIMMLVGIPMYVCASGSLPIVSALMLKGMSPGAAFVFLLAGPATNTAALTLITKEFGIKVTAIFLGSIVVCGLLLGMLLDKVWGYLNINITTHLMHKSAMFGPWMEIMASVILLAGILYNLFSPKNRHL
ncbi:MAG: hypothetical protein A2306_02315 [Omnitrophica WOR_2 bacterium RIFOXYB2_FULL_38_16]|nr:MAG: hypothetical protein A2243_09125 [Omnitrophica WOR_2 bacterium RIFOXYA2_FULL_38_17]OGX50963.1 MAG: hypothetical protein A2267_00155 [Omnitrophica WOR_2 bacterium RIFOXYA12_FULL_38_10]OGX55623.1 MAG: hypothetical protein A2306_02315 [Omnitrophica WOR_2 bacterium RIFOXYB2_FULL_38_16]OGX56802.1 MAG: hypothetical protein A2447_01050 [Omnitrophica WOR_2 bacterium RIFOXYC2_FULL_38_12]